MELVAIWRKTKYYYVLIKYYIQNNYVFIHFWYISLLLCYFRSELHQICLGDYLQILSNLNLFKLYLPRPHLMVSNHIIWYQYTNVISLKFKNIIHNLLEVIERKILFINNSLKLVRIINSDRFQTLIWI